MEFHSHALSGSLGIRDVHPDGLVFGTIEALYSKFHRF